MQSPFIHFAKDGTFQDILWFHTDANLQHIIGTTLGFKVVRTSIFGGIIVGSLTAFVMNRWSDIELPPALSFFSGIRFMPLIAIPAGVLLGLFFLIFWPFVGQLIAFLGTKAALMPWGTDGLFYGMLGRALMPFGLHHIVIALAWHSPLGGELSLPMIIQAATNLGVEGSAEIMTLTAAFDKSGATSIMGDHKIWNFINSLPLNTLPISNTESIPVFQWIREYTGVHAGRFIQDYPVYLGAIQGIGLAIIFTSFKAKRKKTIAIIGSSMLVAFLTGITEPLEFSFLFVAPLFYFLFYVPISGLAYMVMKLLGGHLGVGFARGFIDYIIFGVLPGLKGTNFLYVIPVSLVFGIISFITFYYLIKRFDYKTPGRDETVEVANSKSYQIKTTSKKETEIDQIVIALGGVKNLIQVFACASRLRISLKDASLVNETALKALNHHGLIKKDNLLQIIFGGRSTILASKINQKYQLGD